MSNIVNKIKDKIPGLKKAEIEGLLYLLLSEKELTNNQLIQKTGIPKETLKDFKKAITHMLFKPVGENIKLKSESRKELQKLNPKSYKWRLFSYQEDQFANQLKGIRKKYNLDPKREYDQFFATEATSIAKTRVIEDKFLVAGKRFAFIGDDDLGSICLNIMKLNPQNITVFDIDNDILTVIDRITKDLSINNVHTTLYDARKALDKKYLSKFDVVVIDPPYTKSGVELFVNRAVQMLDGKDKYIFLYFGNSFKTPEKALKVQEIISRFNLEIEDKINKFARYYGAQSIGSASSLYILKTTPFTKPLEESLVSSTIYTYEKQTDEQFPYVDHYTFKLYKVPKDVIKSKNKILKGLGEFCNRHKLKVVDQKVTKFKGGGLTITFVLANSNLNVHTWPEKSALHLDLVTCSPINNKEHFGTNLSELFGTSEIEIRRIE